jgi:uncharacterized LabA/DUF88 family protein
MSIFQPKDRAGLFIDGSNHFETCQRIGYPFDYYRLLTKLKKETNLRRAYYFTAVRPADEMNPQLKGILDWLEYNGFTMRKKPTKEFRDETNGIRNIKGNMDIEMAITAMSMAPHIDRAYLFTGDGDFTCLVEMLQQQDVQVIVASTQKLIADELRRAADEFWELAKMKDEFLRSG